MPKHQPCRTHDMRPMPSMQAKVCRRCGYYEPIEDEEPTIVAGWWVVPCIIGGLLVAAAFVALIF